MPSEPNAYKTLRAFYGDRLAMESREDTDKEFATANDRSVIITLVAQADTSLEYRLITFFPVLKNADKATFQNVFRSEGPLGSLSSKIEIAYNVGAIDGYQRMQLDGLRTIRNAVAHASRIVDFGHPPLQNAIRRIIAPNGMFPLISEDRDGYRRSFIAEAGLAVSMLIYGKHEAVAMMRAKFIERALEPPF
jgi:hypothetical protein